MGQPPCAAGCECGKHRKRTAEERAVLSQRRIEGWAAGKNVIWGLREHERLHGPARKGKKSSEEVSRNYAERQRRLWADPVYAARQRAALNATLKGEKFREYCRGREPRGSGYGKSGIRSDLGHHCRSTWEANYARYLVHQEIGYVFEPHRFEVEVGPERLRYTPDFCLSDGSWVEVKGFWRPHYLRKFEAFLDQYPSERIIVVGQAEYRLIKKEFSILIPEWEKDCV